MLQKKLGLQKQLRRIGINIRHVLQGAVMLVIIVDIKKTKRFKL